MYVFMNLSFIVSIHVCIYIFIYLKGLINVK